MKFSINLLFAALITCACQPPAQFASLYQLVEDMEQLEGSPDYLETPYVTAGNRLYMVGNQDGSFPDIGFHTPGEMGGLWDHPIKLMDGFAAQIRVVNSTEIRCLDKAERFTNLPLGNYHQYVWDDLSVRRFQFVPDDTEGLVVEYQIVNKMGQKLLLDFTFSGQVDLLPVWLSDSLGIRDGKDQVDWDQQEEVVIGRDQDNPWFVVFGSDRSAKAYDLNAGPCTTKSMGNGASASITYSLEIPQNNSANIHFYIGGSYTSRHQALETFHKLKAASPQLLLAKKERYGEIKSTADISIPDKGIQQAYTWLKYNNDWLVREVPQFGKGLGAGIPDYPWWFGCDNTYSLQGVLATGRQDLAKSTLELLHKLSLQANDNGRIIHEVSTNGVVFNKGNINETPHFASMLWKMYEWTGDREMLQRMFPTVKKGLSWILEEQDKNQNLYPDGAGMMEIPGLHSEMIDVVTYTQQGFALGARIAEELGEHELKSSYQNTADQLTKKINEEWWVPQFNSYADFISATGEARKLIDEAMVRADTIDKPWAVAELKDIKQQISDLPANHQQGFVVHRNWVVNTPLETGIADRAKALSALKTARKYTAPFGVYVTGIDRDERQKEATKWKSFSYVGAVMTLPTGVQAIAECNYGRYDQALEYLKMLEKSFSYALPGSMYEVSPDYGMIVQEWNIYAFNYPIIKYYFGINPKAYQKSILIKPRMPRPWDNARLANLPIGDNIITFEKKTENGALYYFINQSQPDWNLQLNLSNEAFKTISINGEPFEFDQQSEEILLTLGGDRNEVKITH